MIPLTQGQVAIVDAADYAFLMQWKWMAAWDRHTQSFYAVRHITPLKREPDGPSQLRVSMHRLLKNAPDDLQVDHFDRDTLNNRRRNLRLASQSQNRHNVHIQRNNTSGFRGVRKYEYYGKKVRYVARIVIAGKLTHIGYFNTAEAASEAFEVKAKEIRGEFYCPPS